MEKLVTKWTFGDPNIFGVARNPKQVMQFFAPCLVQSFTVMQCECVCALVCVCGRIKCLDQRLETGLHLRITVPDL